jgi:hypothetical protein
MTQLISPRNSYLSTVAKYDVVLEYAKNTLRAVEGCHAPSENVLFAEKLFTTIIVYSSTLRRLMPDPDGENLNQIWDLPSTYVIARSLIEAHDKFLYVASSKIPEPEAEFRILLWKYHATKHRYRMLKELRSQRPELEMYKQEASGLFNEIISHHVFTTLEESKQKSIQAQKIDSNNTVDYHFTKEQRCNAFGLDLNFYNTAIMHLSQYVHLYPFALEELIQFRAGSEEALSQMIRSLQYALPFLTRVANEFRTVVNPILTPDPISSDLLKQTLEESEYIYQHGLCSTP